MLVYNITRSRSRSIAVMEGALALAFEALPAPPVRNSCYVRFDSGLLQLESLQREATSSAIVNEHRSLCEDCFLFWLLK